MQPNLDGRRSGCYDLAKTVAILLVILGHATVFYTADGAMTPARSSRFMAAVANYIYAFHMPLFVLLSGCVWGFCIRQGKYRRALPFLWKKAKRLLIPYLAFGLLLVAPVVVLCGFTEESFLQYCIHGILLGYDARHLWYLLVLFFLFCSTLVFKPVLRHSPLLTLPFCVVLFLAANRIPQIWKLRTACKYALFFYLGVCCDAYYAPLEALAHKLRFLLPGFPILLLGSIFWNPNMITETLYTVIGITMVLGAASLLTGSELLPKSRVYQSFQKNSFGLYLFHAMGIYLVYYFLGNTQIAPFFLVGISIAIACALSLGGIWLLRKCKLAFLLGE